MVKKWAEAKAKDDLVIDGAIGIPEDGLTSKEVRAKIEKLSGDITVRINSPGGVVPEGMSIYNALNDYDGHVTVEIDAMAASMGSLVAMAGDVIRAHENSLIMIHDPRNIAIGDAEQLRKDAELLDKISDQMADIYAARSGLSVNRIKKMMSDEVWFSAEEALEQGFIDEIVGEADAQAFRRLDISGLVAVPGRIAAHVAGWTGRKAASAARQTSARKDNDMAKKTTKKAAEKKAVHDNPEGPEGRAVATPDPGPLNADNAALEKAAADAKVEGAAGERDRISGIREIAATAKLDDDAFVNELVESDTPLADAQKKILEKWSEKGGPAINGTGANQVTTDALDKAMAGTRNAIIQRAGQRGVMEKAFKDSKEDFDPGEFRGYRLTDIAAHILEITGVDMRGLRGEMLVSKALTAVGTITQTSSDFSVLLENTMHKVLLANYLVTPDTWTRFCATGSATDFRPHPRYRRGSFGRLDQVPESGEIKVKPIPDGVKELLSVLPYGNIINLSRQAIVNDDMSVFETLAADFGRAAKLSIELDVYAELAKNSNLGPTLNDGDSLFHANHSNIGTAGVPSVTTLGEADDLMGSQTDPSGNEVLDLQPFVFVGPKAVARTARVVNESENDPDVTSKKRANPVRGILSDIVGTARLSGTRWYVFAEPSVAAVLEVLFLNGQMEPRLAMQEAFNQQGLQERVEFDYGVGGIDFRGAITNAG